MKNIMKYVHPNSIVRLRHGLIRDLDSGNSSNLIYKSEGTIDTSSVTSIEKHPIRGIANSWRYKGSPFPLLANIESFKIKLGGYCKFLLSYGMKHRAKLGDPHTLGSTTVISMLVSDKGLSSQQQRFLRTQYKQLSTYKSSGNWTAYWKKAFLLMRYSASFQIASLNAWAPSWYKTERITMVRNLFVGLDKILSGRDLNFVLRRFWIESPKGKWRSLAIPPRSWRLFLHMLNQFIMYAFEETLDKKMYHGFIYGRGCLSWWKELLSSNNLTYYDYIGELDFSSAFPNLSLSCVEKALSESGRVPSNLINFILQILKSPLTPYTSFPSFESYVEDAGNKAWQKGNRSVHMGLSISPILFVIVMDWAFQRINLFSSGEIKILAYADDWSIFLTAKGLDYLNTICNLDSFSDDLELLFNSIPLFKEVGLKIDSKKSGWIKHSGMWLKDYVSLGLKLNIFSGSGSLQGWTRGRSETPWRKGTEGSTLPLTMPLSNNLTSDLDLPATLSIDYILKNRPSYLGLILSKLYIGKLDSKVSQDFNLSKLPCSFLGYYLKDREWLRWKLNLNIANASTFCNELLSVLLTSSPSVMGDKFTLKNYDFSQQQNLLWRLGSWNLVRSGPSLLETPHVNPLLGCVPYDPQNPYVDYFKKTSELLKDQNLVDKYKTDYESYLKGPAPREH